MVGLTARHVPPHVSQTQTFHLVYSEKASSELVNEDNCQVELDPRLWLPGKLSVPNSAGEARAPSVIQALIGGLG